MWYLVWPPGERYVKTQKKWTYFLHFRWAHGPWTIWFVTPFQPVNILSENCAFSSRRNWLCPRWYLSASLSVGRSPFLICFSLSLRPFNPFQVPEDADNLILRWWTIGISKTALLVCGIHLHPSTSIPQAYRSRHSYSGRLSTKCFLSWNHDLEIYRNAPHAWLDLKHWTCCLFRILKNLSGVVVAL